jgi:MoaA/NifB/PqqE/SkfB family radical SAM enzyme
MTGTRPYRAILNFAHRCSMSCEWCYVPFGEIPATNDIAASVVQRIAELEFTSITFGGGDPFQYRFAPELLRRAKSLGLFVHVDTHGRALRQTDESIELIESTIDLLGLPIDGSSPSVHDKMRDSIGHFELVWSRLNWLKPFRTRIKLNTVASSVNVADLTALGDIIEGYGPSRWSIYQYWPIGPGARVSSKHSIDDLGFQRHADVLRTQFRTRRVRLEVNARESRRDTYPIIHHDGEMLVHAPAPQNSYVSIGSIFDVDALEKILMWCSAERPAASDRYLLDR